MATAASVRAPVTHCFLALAPCGCVVSICADQGVFQWDALDYLRQGHTVVWLPVEQGTRRHLDSPPDCPHTPKWGKQ